MRLFQALSLAPHTTVLLDQEASHRIVHVLRKSIGEIITLFNGDRYDYTACITHIHKKQVTVNIIDKQPVNRESPLALTLAQGIARNDRMDVILQKSVELGVQQIIPLITQHTQGLLKATQQQKRFNHWKGIIISACEQSGRAIIPVLQFPQTLTTWLATPPHSLCLICSPTASQSLSALPRASLPSLTVLVGPEGGFSETEMLQATQKNFLAFKLGPRTLRTETAAITALSLLQYQYGDMV